MPIIIGGLQRSSLLDYPEKISAIVFTQGCNFRCGYCHNPELVKFEQKESVVTPSAFFEFLETRKGKLDGVVITGGEPCLQKGLKEFITTIKEKDFLVKLDTNGSRFDVLEDLVKSNLVNYVAMDIKAPLKKYSTICNRMVDINQIQLSINFLKQNKVDYEFRTTVLSSQLTKDDFTEIGQLLKGAKKYYLQKFVSSKILDENLSQEKTYSDAVFAEIKQELAKTIDYVEIR